MLLSTALVVVTNLVFPNKGWRIFVRVGSIVLALLVTSFPFNASFGDSVRMKWAFVGDRYASQYAMLEAYDRHATLTLVIM